MPFTPIQSAYLRAIYTINIGPKPFEFTFARHRFAPGSHSATSLPATWAIITARNPMSIPLDEPANLVRDAALDVALKALGYPVHPAANRAANGSWLEPGRIILDGSRDQAFALARQFDQRTLIWSEGGRTGILDRRTESWIVRPLIWS